MSYWQGLAYYFLVHGLLCVSRLKNDEAEIGSAKTRFPLQVRQGFDSFFKRFGAFLSTKCGGKTACNRQ